MTLHTRTIRHFSTLELTTRQYFLVNRLSSYEYNANFINFWFAWSSSIDSFDGWRQRRWIGFRLRKSWVRLRTPSVGKSIYLDCTSVSVLCLIKYGFFFIRELDIYQGSGNQPMKDLWGLFRYFKIDFWGTRFKLATYFCRCPCRKLN